MRLSEDQFRRFFEQGIPFNAHLGLRIESLAPGKATILLPFRDEHVGDIFRPAVHGGVLAALIDATAGAAVFTLATVKDRVSTIDLRIDYLRPAPKRDLLAVAEVRRMGRRTAVVHTVVTPAGGDDRDPVAEGTGVFSVWRDVGVPGLPPSDDNLSNDSEET